MSTLVWTGGAQEKAQVQTYAFAGTWEADDLIRASFSNGKSYDFTAGSTTTATVVSNLATNWAALAEADFPEFAELTASANSTTFTLTGDSDGTPFTCTLTPLESNGGAAGAQTIEGAGTATTGTAATTPSSPNDWSVAANWSTGAVPVDSDDVVLENSAVDILYGLSQSSIDLTSLTIMASYTGRVGLPRTNEDGNYPEYRTTYLTLGTVTTLKIGQGDGEGSGRIKLSVGSNACSGTIYKTGSREEPDVASLVWKGTHSSNALEILGGDVAIAPFASETATLATLNVSGRATVWASSGLTLTTYLQQGGQVTLEGTGTTITCENGDLTIKGGNITTLNGRKGGVIHYQGSGTITTYNGLPDSLLDFSQDFTARTVATCNVQEGAAIEDSRNTVTWTNGITLQGSGNVTKYKINVGYGRKITPAAA